MTLITDDRLNELVRLIGESPEGICVELGVYKGGSLKYMADRHPERDFYGMDTFHGLPAMDWDKDEKHLPGDFGDTSFEYVSGYLKGNKNVTLIPGYFPESLDDYNLTGVAFVHVDTDFYQSVKNAIDYFYPILKPGGIMVFDDFGWGNCPGVKKALDESVLRYLPTRAEYQAYIVKPFK